MQEGVNILKKHKSKPHITFTKLKRKVPKQKINGNHPTKKKKGTKEKHRINWKTRVKKAINIYLSINTFNVKVVQSKDIEWQTGSKNEPTI